MRAQQRTVRHATDPTLWAGQARWGWRVTPGGKLERDEEEENVVAVVRHMRATGHTLKEIVDLLRVAGVVGRRGTPIGMTRVFEMLHGGRKKSAKKVTRRKKRARAPR